MRSSQAANFNEILQRMQALSMHLDTNQSCEEQPLSAPAHGLLPQPQQPAPTYHQNQSLAGYYQHGSSTASVDEDDERIREHLGVIQAHI